MQHLAMEIHNDSNSSSQNLMLTHRNVLHAVISMGKVPVLAVWLLNWMSLLSSLDEKKKYGQHYLTPKNNNSLTNTNHFLKDYFIYFLVTVFSVSALFSLEEVRLCPSNQPMQLISFYYRCFSKICSKYTRQLERNDYRFTHYFIPSHGIISESCITS